MEGGRVTGGTGRARGTGDRGVRGEGKRSGGLSMTR